MYFENIYPKFIHNSFFQSIPLDPFREVTQNFIKAMLGTIKEYSFQSTTIGK
jgi:hypothetical protein